MNGTIVKLITGVASIATIVCLYGLFFAIQDQFFYKNTSKENAVRQVEEGVTSTSSLKIVALGDSLTRGTGDESGKGYIGYMLEELQEKTDRNITISNLAIKGQRSKQLVEQVQQPEIQRQLKQAEVIVLTIGGNDLFQSGQALFHFSTEQIDRSKESYLTNLSTVFTTIRDINKEAVVYYVALYNPFNDLTDSQTTSSVVREWNYASSEEAAKFVHIITVPTYDLFELNVNDYLYSDKFHPNSQGYKLIGERVASLITFSEEEATND
ncbi:SGNH/GDSL hydrolase family protein [Bacillus timonensis]|nr:SGNH/GDSL hydrolase family protein [Bacillus timonensis]